MLLFAHQFNPFTSSHKASNSRIYLIIKNQSKNSFEWFLISLIMIFHLIMLHSTDYYICIWCTVHYITIYVRVYSYSHTVRLRFSYFCGYLVAFVMRAFLVVARDLFEWDSRTGHFMRLECPAAHPYMDRTWNTSILDLFVFLLSKHLPLHQTSFFTIQCLLPCSKEFSCFIRSVSLTLACLYSHFFQARNFYPSGLVN